VTPGENALQAYQASSTAAGRGRRGWGGLQSLFATVKI